MRGGDSIGDFWFTPHLEEVKRQEKLPLDKRTPYLSAPTLLSKLGNIFLFLKFIQARNIYVGLKLKDITLLNVKIEEMSRRLKKHCSQRKMDIKSFKSETMLTSHGCIEYNKSDHIREIVLLLQRLKRDPSYPAIKSAATKARIYLIFVFCSSNALRSPNIMK